MSVARALHGCILARASRKWSSHTSDRDGTMTTEVQAIGRSLVCVGRRAAIGQRMGGGKIDCANFASGRRALHDQHLGPRGRIPPRC